MSSTLSLETTAYTLDQIIALHQVQLAFAGRSNVGKSSLVNALAGRKKLAKTSATPGKTRSLNFYRVQPENFYIVDLPGYGYARCSQKEREAWGRLMEHYLTTSAELKALVLLLDCRLPPQKLDIHLAMFAQKHHISLLPILTKADKCSQRERTDRQHAWQEVTGGIRPLITSAQTRQGLDEVWTALKNAAGCLRETSTG